MINVDHTSEVKNQVVDKDFISSLSFYHSDLILKDYLNRKVSPEGLNYRGDKLTTLFQLSLILNQLNRDNSHWMKPTCEFLKAQLNQEDNLKVRSLSDSKELMGWEI